jgi:hypothetical protein
MGTVSRNATFFHSGTMPGRRNGCMAPGIRAIRPFGLSLGIVLRHRPGRRGGADPGGICHGNEIDRQVPVGGAATGLAIPNHETAGRQSETKCLVLAGDQGRGRARGGITVGLDLRRALRKMPAKLVEVLVLADLEGYARDEIARLLGIPEGTVASRLHKARAIIERELG